MWESGQRDGACFLSSGILVCTGGKGASFALAFQDSKNAPQLWSPHQPCSYPRVLLQAAGQMGGETH